jgi:hypothetical protein
VKSLGLKLTEILKIGCDQETNEMKVLGVIFDKNGVSEKN